MLGKINRHEFEQSPGDVDGQGSLAYCSPWGCKELDMTERLNGTELKALGDQILNSIEYFMEMAYWDCGLICLFLSC